MTATTSLMMNEIAVSHFGKRAVKGLAAKGITLVGMTIVPDMTSSMPYANGQTAYQLNDNGMGIMRTLMQVLALAK